MKNLFCTLAIAAAITVVTFAPRPGNVTVTAYTAQPGDLTADGSIPVEGVTCAAPRKIPFGTRLKIQGVGVRVVQDRLALRYDDRVDIFFARREDAVNFGIRELRVTVVK